MTYTVNEVISAAALKNLTSGILQRNGRAPANSGTTSGYNRYFTFHRLSVGSLQKTKDEIPEIRL
jgi:hypothetical protein